MKGNFSALPLARARCSSVKAFLAGGLVAAGLGVALALLLQNVAIAGGVPNPVNAPASIAHAGDALMASGTKAQQAADSGLSLTSEAQNSVLAGPSGGGAGAPAFRALTGADMPASGAGSGSVTSVTVTLPGEFSCSGAPITAAGTIACSWGAESANLVLAGPTSGGAATPRFRALVAADIPSLAYDAAGAAATAQSTAETYTDTHAAPISTVTATTVAGLPAPSAGARGFVTDSTLALSGANVGAAVVGGGANKVPVYSDGVGWFIG